MSWLQKRACRPVCAFLILLSISACATSPQTRQLLDEPPDLPDRVELAEVPFYPQQEYHCGPAALAAVINYRGASVTPEQIAGMIYVPELKGSLQTEVTAAARQFDLLPVRLEPRMESLLRELDAGNPVFVLQNLAVDWYPMWHYEVVIGYDFDSGDMILRSGTNRRLTRSFATFEKTWQRAGYWGLVMVPPEQVPPTAGADAFLDAVIGLEQVGRTSSANRAYLAALQRWPDSLLAYSGLGNTAFALGNYADAEKAYRSALEIDPRSAAIWNNLAYALARLGEREASLAAIERAIELEPENANFVDSRAELAQQPAD
jgi:hypothetical protein